jgi:hypothetical protein
MLKFAQFGDIATIDGAIPFLLHWTLDKVARRPLVKGVVELRKLANNQTKLKGALTQVAESATRDVGIGLRTWRYSRVMVLKIPFSMTRGSAVLAKGTEGF